MCLFGSDPNLTTHLAIVRGTSRKRVSNGWHQLMSAENAVLAVLHRESLLHLLMPCIRPRHEVFVLTEQAQNERDSYPCLIKTMGFELIIGSPAALVRVAVRTLRRRRAVVAIAVDGPFGPAGMVKQGAAMLSFLSGAPLFAARCHARSWQEDATWDLRICPKPFNELRFEINTPLSVESRSSIGAVTLALQEVLNSQEVSSAPAQRQ